MISILPAGGPDQAYDGAGDHGAALVLKNSSLPRAVDDLRRYRHEREGREEVGDLVVERDRLEEVPQKAGPVESDADEYEGYDPATRH